MVILFFGCGHNSTPTPPAQPQVNPAPLIPGQSFQKVTLSTQFYSEGVAVADINRDGKLDIVSGPYWYAGPDFQTRFAYFQPVAFDPVSFSNDFLTFVYDFNHDGWPDILVLNFPGQDASWFENPQGKDQLWVKHQVIDVVANESPTLIDLNGDGIPELTYLASGGHPGWAAPDPADPAKPWVFHPIAPASYTTLAHGWGVGDVNGDGRLDILEANGWWEQPASLANDPVWTFHPFNFGPGAQMWAVDIDGDGLNDVVTSLNAHGFGLAWFQQIRQGQQISFCKHLITNDTAAPNRYGVAFSQPHAVVVADIDGDGIPDIVTGKRHWAHGPNGDVDPNGPSVLYWFRTVRTSQGVDFVPQLIDDNTGIGTQFFVGDVNGDGLPDIVVGDKLGTFFLQRKQQLDPSTLQPQSPLVTACQP